MVDTRCPLPTGCASAPAHHADGYVGLPSWLPKDTGPLQISAAQLDALDHLGNVSAVEAVPALRRSSRDFVVENG